MPATFTPRWKGTQSWMGTSRSGPPTGRTPRNQWQTQYSCSKGGNFFYKPYLCHVKIYEKVCFYFWLLILLVFWNCKEVKLHFHAPQWMGTYYFFIFQLIPFITFYEFCLEIQSPNRFSWIYNHILHFFFIYKVVILAIFFMLSNTRQFFELRRLLSNELTINYTLNRSVRHSACVLYPFKLVLLERCWPRCSCSSLSWLPNNAPPWR